MEVGGQHKETLQSPPLFTLIVHSIAKKVNIGNIIRSAVGFGVHSILVAGNKNTIQLFGSQGTQKHVQFLFFEGLTEAVHYAKTELQCRVCGIEIKPEAKDVTKQPFEGNTAFMLGNEGTGLSQKQAALCDYFVYIPQYGRGTASLNVTIAGSIVFHQFGLWAAYKEAGREESREKFLVDEVVVDVSAVKTSKESVEIKNKRQVKQSEVRKEAEMVITAGAVGDLFS